MTLNFSFLGNERCGIGLTFFAFACLVIFLEFWVESFSERVQFRYVGVWFRKSRALLDTRECPLNLEMKPPPSVLCTFKSNFCIVCLLYLYFISELCTGVIRFIRNLSVRPRLLFLFQIHSYVVDVIFYCCATLALMKNIFPQSSITQKLHLCIIRFDTKHSRTLEFKRK